MARELESPEIDRSVETPTRRGGNALPFHRSQPDPPADPDPGRARALEHASGAQDRPSLTVASDRLPETENRLQSHFGGRCLRAHQRRNRCGAALATAIRAPAADEEMLRQA